MKCFKCSDTEFILENAKFSLSVKNEPLEIIITTHVCRRCRTPLLNDEHVNTLRKASVDQFRKNHGLLSSQQIVTYRKEMKLSQKAFADYLGVGEASIKRWETYYIQDGSQDELIRLKCDFDYAKEHLMRMKNSPNLLNGMKHFSHHSFRNTALFFGQNVDSLSLGLLSTLQFYSDFLNYKKQRRSITGAQYISLKNGPFPNAYDYKSFEKENLFKMTGQKTILAQKEPDMTSFDSSEKETLDYVLKCCKNQCLVRLSQLEKAFHECTTDGHISYEHAHALLI